MSENVEIMNEFLAGVMGTEAWRKIAMEDPQIKAMDAALSTLLTRYCPALPDSQRGKIEDAICEAEAAYTDAAFLFGVRVAQTIQAFAANPGEYSAYCMGLRQERGVPA